MLAKSDTFGVADATPSRRRILSQRRASTGLWVTTIAVVPWPLLQRFEELDDRRPGLRVEAAGGLVGEQQRRLEQQRAAERDPLLLAARELRREVLRRARPCPTCVEELGARGAASSAPARPAIRPGSSDVLERGEVRQQLVELEDEADRAVAERGQLGRPTARPSACPPTSIVAARPAGRAPPSRCSSVDLPEPDGPTIASRSPASTSRSMPRSTSTVARGVAVALVARRASRPRRSSSAQSASAAIGSSRATRGRRSTAQARARRSVTATMTTRSPTGTENGR